jgi:hypothetical protein
MMFRPLVLLMGFLIVVTWSMKSHAQTKQASELTYRVGELLFRDEFHSGLSQWFLELERVGKG